MTDFEYRKYAIQALEFINFYLNQKLNIYWESHELLWFKKEHFPHLLGIQYISKFLSSYKENLRAAIIYLSDVKNQKVLWSSLKQKIYENFSKIKIIQHLKFDRSQVIIDCLEKKIKGLNLFISKVKNYLTFFNSGFSTEKFFKFDLNCEEYINFCPENNSNNCMFVLMLKDISNNRYFYHKTYIAKSMQCLNAKRIKKIQNSKEVLIERVYCS